MTMPSTPYRLAVIDLDETLLGPDKLISPENSLALETLRAAGIQIVPASGRHHDNIIIYDKLLPGEGWIISSQGAVVKNAHTKEVLYELTMPNALAQELQRLGLAQSLDMIAYHRSGVYKEIDGEWSKLSGVHAGMTTHLVDFSSLVEDGGIIKLIWYSEPDHIESLRIALAKEFEGRLYVVKTEDNALEFLSPQANKVHGAQAVAQRMGISAAEVIAFGDGNNDIELLTWAGASVAMHHGRDALKSIAHHVSPPGPPETALARAVTTLFSGAT